MSTEQVGGLVRAVLAAISGYAIGKGYGDAELWVSISGAAVLIVTGAWSFLTKKKSA